MSGKKTKETKALKQYAQASAEHRRFAVLLGADPRILLESETGRRRVLALPPVRALWRAYVELGKTLMAYEQSIDKKTLDSRRHAEFLRALIATFGAAHDLQAMQRREAYGTSDDILRTLHAVVELADAEARDAVHAASIRTRVLEQCAAVFFPLPTAGKSDNVPLSNEVDRAHDMQRDFVEKVEEALGEGQLRRHAKPLRFGQLGTKGSKTLARLILEVANGVSARTLRTKLNRAEGREPRPYDHVHDAADVVERLKSFIKTGRQALPSSGVGSQASPTRRR